MWFCYDVIIFDIPDMWHYTGETHATEWFHYEFVLWIDDIKTVAVNGKTTAI